MGRKKIPVSKKRKESSAKRTIPIRTPVFIRFNSENENENDNDAMLLEDPVLSEIAQPMGLSNEILFYLISTTLPVCFRI